MVHNLASHAVLGLFVATSFLIFLVCSVFWLWALIRAIQNKALTGNQRICWVLVIIFLHILGALIYLIAAPSEDGKATSP